MNILNKFKRGLAAVLSLSVAMSAIFVFHYPLMKARAEGEHNHPICGDVNCLEHGDSEEWTATNSLPTNAGYYYLTGDVEITKFWMPADNTYLCLNGYSITLVEAGGENNDESDGESSGDDSAEALVSANAEDDELESTAVIYVTDNFTLSDCGENNAGTITHSDKLDGSGVEVAGGTFEMYGGTIAGNTSSENGGGVYIYNDGTFNMYGGKITENNTNANLESGPYLGGGVYNHGIFNMCGGLISDNTASGKGGGVCNYGTFKMHGGTISGNEASGKGSGVYNVGAMTVGGTATIIDNSADNVYLQSGKYISISKENPLRGKDTQIGVTVANFESEDVSITDENDKNYRLFFSSDNDNYNVIYADKTLKLSTEPVDEDNEEVKPENPEIPDIDEGHKHDGIIFEPIKDGEELPTVKGDYYLETDVKIYSTWKPADGTTLCLNGNTITIAYNVPAISVTGSFVLYDEEGGGVITHYELFNEGVGVEIKDGGAFAIYGGEISRNGDSGVAFEGTGSLTVGGTARILDDVLLQSGKTITVDKDKPLKEDAEIHVWTNPTPTEGNDVAITEANGEDITKFFESARKDYYIVNGANNAVMLSATKPDAVPEAHNHGNIKFKPVSSEADFQAAKAGFFYLTKNVTLSTPWTPAENTRLCLNGHTLSNSDGTPISIENPSFTLCDCKGRDAAGVSVLVTENGSITVGGKLKAEITLSEGKRIGIDALENGAEIRVATDKLPTEGNNIPITDKNSADITGYFTSSDSSYTIINGAENAVELSVKTEQPPIIDPTRHVHPICGDDYCKQHIDITWTEWTSSTSLPAEAGCYYLTRDVTLGARWNVTSDISLCLNGYTIKSNAGGAVVYVSSELGLCDCGSRAPTGAVTHAQGVSGRGVYIAPGGALTMYGGVIRGNIYDNGAGVYNDGVFTMRGGSIVNNEATSVGGGLFNSGVAVVEGEIYGNNARQSAGGVYQDGKLTVNNNAYIINNTVNGGKSNVYLTDGSRIIIGSGFDGELGVTLETIPKSTGSVTIAKGTISAKTLDKIKSDSSSLTIKRSGDTLTLSRKTSSDEDDGNDESLELDIKSKTSEQIPLADRSAIFEVLKTMPDWIVGAYFDITLYDDDDAKIGENTRNLDVELTIPSSIRAENRAYKVIRVHNGKAALLDDVDNDPNTITVRSRYFSTYAIVYSVTQNAAANGNGTSAGTGAYGNPSMGVRDEIPIAGLACGFTVLALAAPGKKIDN